MSFFLKQFFFRRRRKGREIYPDEVMLDSSNLPNFDTTQFEGRLEKPISKLALYGTLGVFGFILAAFLFQSGNLQIVHGEEYAARSERNLLRPIPIFAGRGVIYDRNGIPLAWNAPSTTIIEPADTATTTQRTFSSLLGSGGEDVVAHREYATSSGLSHVLGYVQYPSKDNNGFYYQEDFEGVDGAEQYFNQRLSGQNGSRLVEVDAPGNIVSDSVVHPPGQGENLTLSIDSRVQQALYDNIKDISTRVGFSGGAGVIMDVRSGEIIALTSYPEYSSQVMSDRTDTARVRAELSNPDLPFLNRAVDGLYTPGSIVKPYIALGALTEGVIDPSTVIVTNGSISIPNPFDSTKSTVFNDWKNLGALDMRHAIAMSSDVYFYTIGGGYKDQKGLGISNIDKYLQKFGLGSSTLPSFVQGKAGTIPTPQWKKKTFDEDWYLGDTYHTAIGQYGFQVTPIQMVRAVAAVANSGNILTPTILKDSPLPIDHVIDIPEKNFQVVRQGMRLGAVEGTGKLLNEPFTTIAIKSGTAELGQTRQKVNSWITGFWPYENPKYAFAVVLEKGSVHNLIGAAAAMKQELEWMNEHTPEYFK